MLTMGTYSKQFYLITNLIVEPEMFKPIFALILAAPIVQFTAVAPSFAGANAAINSTCASLDPTNGGSTVTVPENNSGIQVDLSAGDVVTFGGEAGPSVLLDGARTPLGGSFTAPTSESFLFSFPGSFTATCSPASNQAAEQNPANQSARLINRYWWIAASNRTDTQLEGVGDAVQNSIGGVRANNYVDENSFSLSSSGLAAFAADKNKRTATTQSIITSALKDGPIPDDAPAVQPRFNIWLNGRFNHFDGNNDQFDANIGSFNVGADYRISSRFVLGALVGYSTSDFDPAGVGSLEADAFSIGGYFGAKLGGSLVAEGFVAYNRSNYDETFAGATADYNGDGIAAALRVHGSFTTDNLTIQPRASISINAENQDSFATSAGTVVGSQDFNGTQISIGPRVFFDNIGSGAVRPWVEARYDLFLADSSSFNVTGTSSLSDVSSTNFQAGLDAKIGSGTLRISGSVGGIGSGEFISYGGTAQYRVSF